MKLLSFADEVDDSEADGASAQAEWSSSARRAAANKSKSSHDLLEDPELARDPAYDLAALQKQGAPGVRAPAAASEAGEKKSGGDKAGAAAAAGPAADDELEDDEAAEAKRYSYIITVHLYVQILNRYTVFSKQ